MSSSDPIDLLFGGLEKLGPGGNAETLHVLRLLPKEEFGLVVDAGCGVGRQRWCSPRNWAFPSMPSIPISHSSTTCSAGPKRRASPISCRPIA